VTAFAVPRLGAAAGVVVTASHNPPEYNGYKVYLDRGAQIIPPHDGGIAARIEAAPPARDVALVGAEHELIRDVSEIEEAYVSAVAALREPSVPQAAIQIAYTALHGVGERPARAAFTRAGFDRVSSVAEQAEPDGRFPTVRFPNPEEPAAMERLLALADEARADVAIANDPDADRLAAAVRDPAGGMQVLTGNEIGVLLAHHILSRDPDPSPDRLVITTIVSSAQLARIARDFGVRYAETLTGFKWIANRSMELERGGARFVFGYEEALGYTVGTLARDKDGIGAAVVFAELCAACRARGETVPEYLARIRDRHGFYVSRQKSLTLPGRDGAEKIHAAMRALRAVPPLDLGGLRVERFRDLAVPNDEMPAADVLMIDLEGGGRAAVRPSGTEPKIKLYLEVAESDPAKARRRLDVLERSLLAASRLA
jgi:phosphomannomutase